MINCIDLDIEYPIFSEKLIREDYRLQNDHCA